MPERSIASKPAPLTALCASERYSFPVALSDITPEGCAAEAECDWDALREFLHLRIADRIDINGCVTRRSGRKAQIRFFGQLHPTAIDALGR